MEICPCTQPIILNYTKKNVGLTFIMKLYKRKLKNWIGVTAYVAINNVYIKKKVPFLEKHVSSKIRVARLLTK